MVRLCSRYSGEGPHLIALEGILRDFDDETSQKETIHPEVSQKGIWWNPPIVPAVAFERGRIQ